MPCPSAETGTKMMSPKTGPTTTMTTRKRESAPCPECGETVHVITGKCPSCGYWLSDADRHAMWTGESKPMWLKVTAVVVLVALLAGMFGFAAGMF